MRDDDAQDMSRYTYEAMQQRSLDIARRELKWQIQWLESGGTKEQLDRTREHIAHWTQVILENS